VIEVVEQAQQLLLAERLQLVVGPVDAHRRMEDGLDCTS
jgi:hypothetical protein